MLIHHVVPVDGHWAVIVESKRRVSKYFKQRKEAIGYAHNRAGKQDRLVVHNKDGTFRDFLHIPSLSFILRNEDIRFLEKFHHMRIVHGHTIKEPYDAKNYG